MLGWLVAVNLVSAIDSIVWYGDVHIVNTAWCDIVAAVITGFNVAIPLASLHLVVDLVQPSFGSEALPKSSRTKQTVQSLLYSLTPVVYIALHIIVQDHRYDIVQHVGCRPATYASVPSIILVWLPPILLSVATLILSVTLLQKLTPNRSESLYDTASIRTSRSSSNSAPRHIFLAIVLAAWSINTTAVDVSIQLRLAGGKLLSWPSLDAVHAEHGRIDIFTITDHRALMPSYMFLWWATPIAAAVYIALAAGNEEIVQAWAELSRRLGVAFNRKRSRRDEVREKHQSILPEMDSRASLPSVFGSIRRKPSSRGQVPASRLSSISTSNSGVRDSTLPALYESDASSSYDNSWFSSDISPPSGCGTDTRPEPIGCYPSSAGYAQSVFLSDLSPTVPRRPRYAQCRQSRIPSPVIDIVSTEDDLAPTLSPYPDPIRQTYEPEMTCSSRYFDLRPQLSRVPHGNSRPGVSRTTSSPNLLSMFPRPPKARLARHASETTTTTRQSGGESALGRSHGSPSDPAVPSSLRISSLPPASVSEPDRLYETNEPSTSHR
ncbi:hypothetical protein PUNSTDRAFT_137177 [Punctularia strigosozonata HHB-11173 SS5]|uniref:uncharacterized protein n=1 Tax=Punctularia strigosozonata (strain HHB-11173) TaxID=741275 RepID=UPI0004417EB4|nr:uncharacterized protein PUNSTDRAFT_137177 [Punctularia strigosozonata HHB-11173 SS5]EIN05684.1 hypothetical protein PUNSTDRAFT_137177 [Punctularia strigosozonata HHB-11173 SS5]